jgi:hypothetical protein
MTRRALFIAALCVAPLVFGTGCLLSSSISNSVSAGSESLSDSSKSVSDSISDGSRSSSETDSETDTSARLYREDVRALAHNAAEEAVRTETFLHDLGRLSEAHGVTHWEARDGAWTAVGGGLAEGGLAADDVDAFLAAIGRDDAPRDLVMQGFIEAGL